MNVRKMRGIDVVYWGYEYGATKKTSKKNHTPRRLLQRPEGGYLLIQFWNPFWSQFCPRVWGRVWRRDSRTQSREILFHAQQELAK